MDAHNSTERRDNARLGDIANRSEKGTALTLIRAETRARDEKTARLKALRLAQEAEGIVASDREGAALPLERAARTTAKKPAARKPAARKAAAQRKA